MSICVDVYVARSPALIRMTSKVELANGVTDVGTGEITFPDRRLDRCQYSSSAEVLSVVVCNPGLTPISAGSAIRHFPSCHGCPHSPLLRHQQRRRATSVVAI